MALKITHVEMMSSGGGWWATDDNGTLFEPIACFVLARVLDERYAALAPEVRFLGLTANEIGGAIFDAKIADAREYVHRDEFQVVGSILKDGAYPRSMI